MAQFNSTGQNTSTWASNSSKGRKALINSTTRTDITSYSSIHIDDPISRSTSRNSSKKKSKFYGNETPRVPSKSHSDCAYSDGTNIHERVLTLEGMIPSVLQRMENIEYATDKVKDLSRRIEKMRRKTNQIISFVKKKTPPSHSALESELSSLKNQLTSLEQQIKSNKEFNNVNVKKLQGPASLTSISSMNSVTNSSNIVAVAAAKAAATKCNKNTPLAETPLRAGEDTTSALNNTFTYFSSS